MSGSDCTWVGQRLGIAVEDRPPADPGATDAAGPLPRLADLAGLAVRQNPRRAHLVVSHVLGKHIPVHPWQAVEAGHRLGRLAWAHVTAAGWAGPPGAPGPVVLGYAETATALGHLVADVADHSWYLHSTRRRVEHLTPLGGFEETHSHATRHLLLPVDPRPLSGDSTMIIVDDELTTGATALGTIRALHPRYPRSTYLLATLVDLRSAADRRHLDEAAAHLGATIDVVALASADLRIPPDVLDRGRRLARDLEAPDPVRLGKPAPVCRLEVRWPAEVPYTGRHGTGAAHRGAFADALTRMRTQVSRYLPRSGRILVLGTEELMYTPLMLAARLAGERTQPIRFASTTRSPILPVDSDGYAVRTRLSFHAHEPLDPGDCDRRFAYNIAPTPAGRPFDHIVVVVDAVSDTPALWDADGLVEVVRRCCDTLTVVVLPDQTPAGPGGIR